MKLEKSLKRFFILNETLTLELSKIHNQIVSNHDKFKYEKEFIKAVEQLAVVINNMNDKNTKHVVLNLFHKELTDYKMNQ